MTFAKFLKKTMEEKHMSVRRVAKAVGVDPSFFSKMLTGKRSPPSDEKTIRRFARVVGADPIYLIFLTGRVPSEFQELFLSEKFIQSLYRAMKSAPPVVEPKSPRRIVPAAPAATDEVDILAEPVSPQNSRTEQEDISEDLL